jgi:hypothetical protein
MKTLDKKRLSGLYNIKINCRETIGDVFQSLLHETKLSVNQCLKIALMIAYKKKAINFETVQLEFACLDAFWENPETKKEATQK